MPFHPICSCVKSDVLNLQSHAVNISYQADDRVFHRGDEDRYRTSSTDDQQKQEAMVSTSWKNYLRNEKRVLFLF